MATKRLYQQDVYLTECDASVLEIRELEEKNKDVALYDLALDKSVFFPEGGGQPCDLGNINGIPVTWVYEKDKLVYHRICLPSGSPAPLRPGSPVRCVIDWNRRFDNMQRHCGEHILSGMFFREYGGVNRGFHMGEESMTIDINLEEQLEFTELTWDMAMHIERLANEAVWANTPVITRYFDSREEAERLPLRKKLALDEDIIVVCVGDVRNPSDCVACCGTHPAAAGQVGLIKILKLESYKGMTRVYCEAGQRALALFDTCYDTVAKLGHKYSAAAADLLDKIAIADEKAKAVKSELFVLKQSVIKSRSAEIREALVDAPTAAEPGKTSAEKDVLARAGILLREYDDLKVDDLLNIGRPLIPEIKKLLLLVSVIDNTLLLFSDGKAVDCGKLVKENASIYNGKGGGSKENARALFPSREYLLTFIDLIEKHLR